jgi:hypothetical protein
MIVFIDKVTKTHVEFVKKVQFPIFVLSKPETMKKVLAFVALVVLLASCSQYTCPTYSKSEVKRPAEQRI